MTSNLHNYRYVKRAVDCLLAVLLCILLSPLLAFIALSVKLTSKGPVLFSQKRIGANRNGRMHFFTIYKFRTMQVDTPDLPSHLINASDWYTPIGKILRRTSLDELPQLFNIMKGDMALVGPRPALWSQLDLYEARERVGANDILPGLTGWAQINGRDELSVTEKVRYDEEYYKMQSALFDLKCIVCTFYKVATSQGIVEKKR